MWVWNTSFSPPWDLVNELPKERKELVIFFSKLKYQLILLQKNLEKLWSTISCSTFPKVSQKDPSQNCFAFFTRTQSKMPCEVPTGVWEDMNCFVFLPKSGRRATNDPGKTNGHGLVTYGCGQGQGLVNPWPLELTHNHGTPCGKWRGLFCYSAWAWVGCGSLRKSSIYRPINSRNLWMAHAISMAMNRAWVL